MEDEMSKRVLHGLVLTAALVLVAIVGCEQEKQQFEKGDFYGAWFPCLDESCEVPGEQGIAFAEDRWFYRGSYEAPSEPGEEAIIEFDERECCWDVKGDHIVLDLGDSYQSLWPRFEKTDVMQLEMLGFRVLDRETQDWHTHGCHEDEVFDPVDAGDQEDPGAWTPEVCWTEHWAPLGRAARLLEKHDLDVLTFDPDEGNDF